jgi:hypothetical protein
MDLVIEDRDDCSETPVMVRQAILVRMIMRMTTQCLYTPILGGNEAELWPSAGLPGHIAEPRVGKYVVIQECIVHCTVTSGLC